MDETVFDVAVIGLGYIGLPTAASFAAKGKRVAGVDVKRATVDAVNRGEVPFVEPDMGVVVSGAVSLGNLVAMTTVPAADAFIIAVPTPLAEGNGADLSYLRSALDALAPQLRGGRACRPGIDVPSRHYRAVGGLPHGAPARPDSRRRTRKGPGAHRALA